MDIAIVGSGYVGLVTGACLADFGLRVICVDSDPKRIDLLRAGQIPFYEPGLADLVHRNVAARRLEFTCDLQYAVRRSLVVFVAVGTPEGPNGEANLSQVIAAVSEIAMHMDGYRLIVMKSTVPAGTGRLIRRTMEPLVAPQVTFDVASNPEFLREGSAVNDFMRPDRVVIGTDSDRATAILREIYRPLYLIETPIVVTEIETAEMIKCAANAFLAVRISFMNEIANLCDHVGADVHVVAKGMGLDKRIGSKFLHPGPGYGGSCFPKDTRALAALGAQSGVPQRIVETTIDVNRRQWQRTVEKVVCALAGAPERKVAVLGLSFKPNTSDIREAPAVYLCAELAKQGVAVRAYDPVAMPHAAEALRAHSAEVSFAADAYDAMAGACAVVIMTEWNEFRGLDLERTKALLARPVLIDARNVLEPARVREAGFEYYSTGRSSVGMGVMDATPVLAVS